MIDRSVYDYKPAPRLNPEARLDGAWVVVSRGTGRMVTRFKTDGRDRCEAWITRRMKRRSR